MLDYRSENWTLLSDFPRKTASTESQDSGVDDCHSPFIPATEAADHLPSHSDSVFPPPTPPSDHRPSTMSGNDSYVGLDDVATMSPTLTPIKSPAGYVTAWNDVENNTMLSLRSVDEHLLPHINDVEQQQDADLFTASTPNNHASSNDDADSLSARQDWTTDTVLRVSYSEEEHRSADGVASTMATNQLDAAQLHNTAQQSNAVRTEDTSILPYITLGQLHSNHSTATIS